MMYSSLTRKGFAAFVLGLTAAVAFVGVAQADLFVSKKEVMRRQRLMWLEMKRHLPQSPPRVQKYVQCIAYDLIDVLPASFQKLDWEVIVFDNGMVNAQAIPGGKIVVYSGLLKVADTPDAMATVLGHEIAHLTLNHVMERARRHARTEALEILGTAATGLGDWVREGAAIGLNYPFARKQESEADRVGLKYMAEAGFDPRAALGLWQNMMKAVKDKPPLFLSTHPADQQRLDDIVSELAPSLVEFNKARAAGKRPNCHL